MGFPPRPVVPACASHQHALLCLFLRSVSVLFCYVTEQHMTELGWAFGDWEDEFIVSLEAILLHGEKKNKQPKTQKKTCLAEGCLMSPMVVKEAMATCR